MSTDLERIRQALSGTDAWITTSKDLIRREKFESASPVVLDLGCGLGASRALFESVVPGVVWHGTDIDGSPEVRSRSKALERVSTFDGVNLPYEAGTFDLIYCHQVLEHARHPDPLVQDVFRALKPGGVFLGSVAYLEPYHSHSIFNFTPYGVLTVLENAGFRDVQLFPAADAFKVILRNLARSFARRYPAPFRTTPLYRVSDLIGRLRGKSAEDRALTRLLASGAIAFRARRAATD